MDNEPIGATKGELMNYFIWRRQIIAKKNYEKLRLFQFHAISAVGSFVLGLAALVISVTQVIQNSETNEATLLEQRKVKLQSEIATSSGLMKSTGFKKTVEP